ncbi:glucosaminidase domain-containing protein [Oscillochloris sp. ZM17-4]|uniref:glucosaminidase domain-containing protein n=1 Tax=Oscillochloris sp. ZM17-4 TaxID=2866714 RepID=UPI001C72E179|nr:glucosaminidase domain-containing protein [Oscillochloris sp. ZM17-4]MBX0328684.1 glucosaminidase domain-containing protein [Oscillochloris sp. ZM17-4]
MGQITELSSIFGPATAGEEQVTLAILARPHTEYTDYDIAGVIVPTYFDYCLGVGINPVIVLAQMVWETGNLTSWWCGRPQRNPAGIGVNGRRQAETPADRTAWAWKAEYRLWLAGVSFDTWKDDAIPAHIGRLLAWFTKPAQRSVIQRQLIDRALTYRPLDLKHHGSATCLKHLGKVHNPSGEGWASPGPTYGRNLATTALRLERGR